ncbi:methylmalonyl-CoA mutase family protein [Reichenbachiella agarivorans]|uniref:Methylmalonyl-CoA mutase family protein n=1 Tax=Reichenbachiella agarivorans TaxID=2979464 RepID=A0ABY6CS41_9BACT|nr:methylmalonyl-CoA mutase family protein [Reichenbachiella agarivorans]UXP32188.1 methylmalonyl-CoA mutase family protein [Reichenbachiella agarivorans]
MKAFGFSEFSSLSKDNWVESNLKTLGIEAFHEMFHRKFIVGMGVDSYYDRSDTEGLPQIDGFSHTTGWNYHERVASASTENLTEIQNLGVQGVILSDMKKLDGIALNELGNLLVSLETISADEWRRPKGEMSMDGFVFAYNLPLQKFQKYRTSMIDIRQGKSHNDILYEIVGALLQLHEKLKTVEEEDFGQFFEQLFIRTSISTSYYQEILKLRCLHSLFSAVLDQYDVDDVSIPILAELGTGLENMELEQQLIRLTSVMTSAILGGASDIEVALFADDYAKTRYRNVSNLLREEAYLSTVSDPLKGSYFFEKVGLDLSKEAWSRFQLVSKQADSSWFLSDYSQYQKLFA